MRKRLETVNKKELYIIKDEQKIIITDENKHITNITGIEGNVSGLIGDVLRIR